METSSRLHNSARRIAPNFNGAAPGAQFKAEYLAALRDEKTGFSLCVRDDFALRRPRAASAKPAVAIRPKLG
jgi:hypothetical protein